MSFHFLLTIDKFAVQIVTQVLHIAQESVLSSLLLKKKKPISLARKTITTLGAVDVVPSLPEDELTVIIFVFETALHICYFENRLCFTFVFIRNRARRGWARWRRRRRNIFQWKRKPQWELISEQRNYSDHPPCIYFFVLDMRRLKFHWKKWFSQFSGRGEISMKVKLKSAHCCCSPSFTRTSWINILYLVQLTPWHFPFLKAQVIDGKVEDAEILRSWAYLVWRRCYQNTFSGKVHKSYIRHGAHC